MLRVKRDSAEIENLKKVIGTLQEERDRADKRIEANEKKLDLFARRDLIKMRAINMAPGCRFIPEGKACPVLEQLHADCEKNEGVCRID
ncbi:MAG: hypothetical protein NC324_03005 [Bacteroides sp.]|nr:hypothetical protein [Bacteroides sp.]